MDEATVPAPDLPQPLPANINGRDIQDETPNDDQPHQDQFRQEQEQEQSAPTFEKWTRTPHPRGRQAKDPHAVSVRFQCSSMESMEAQLREYIANPTAPAEHATLQFVFPTSAAFMVYAGDSHPTRVESKTKPVHLQTLNRTAISVVDALSQMERKEQLRKQKAIAKAIVDSIQTADGNRYSFHNNWVSKEDEACRFSYYCNDSTLNKGRAANEGAGMIGKKPVKPVYDCNGLLHIKFSVTKQSLEVHYRHIPVHKTYEERAPVPRKDSKRRKFLEIFAPDKLPQPGDRKRKAKDPSQPKESRAKKKRRATEPLPGTADAIATNGDDSLAPLMDFLGAAEKESQQPSLNGGYDPSSLSETPLFPLDNIDALKKTNPRPRAPRRASSTPKRGRPKPSNIPGTMAGYLTGNEQEIQWTYEQNKPAQHDSTPSEPLQGIAAAAAAAAEVVINQPPPEPKSELDLLKEKLLEAEQRIQRLESEKQRPSMGPPGWPPPAPPVVPQGYGYPYPGYAYPQNGIGGSASATATYNGGGRAQQQQQQGYQYPPPQQNQLNGTANGNQRSGGAVSGLNGEHAGQRGTGQGVGAQGKGRGERAK